MTSLKAKYKKEVVPQMMKTFGYKNVMAVPKIKKVVINSCFGKEVATKASGEREKMQTLIAHDLGLITGQKPKLSKSKKSIAVRFSERIKKQELNGFSHIKTSKIRRTGGCGQENTKKPLLLCKLLKSNWNI